MSQVKRSIVASIAFVAHFSIRYLPWLLIQSYRHASCFVLCVVRGESHESVITSPLFDSHIAE